SSFAKVGHYADIARVDASVASLQTNAKEHSRHEEIRNYVIWIMPGRSFRLRSSSPFEPRCDGDGREPWIQQRDRQLEHAVSQQPSARIRSGDSVLRQHASLDRQLFYADDRADPHQ